MDLLTLIVSVITLSNIVLAGAVVFIERRDIGSTWAWLMVLFFIPLFGFFFYIFFGRQLKKSNFYDLTKEQQELLVNKVDQQMKLVDDHQDGLIHKYADLIKMNLRSRNALLTTGNDVLVLSDGREKFDALFHDIRNAEHEINVQYYIIKPDELGKQLRDELTRKAREGVKVRILYDEVGSRRMTSRFFRELISYGGEAQAFFPSIFRFVNFRINNRNHRKFCVIDGRIGYIGGFNVGDEYLGLDAKMGYWRDTHVRITGDAVDQIQLQFILDWNKTLTRHKIDPTAVIAQYVLGHPRDAAEAERSAVQIIASGPNSRIEHLKNTYLKLMMSAKKSIYIQTPYFIPDSSFMDVCKMALLSGVDVRIMIPNRPDHLFVYSATLAHAAELLPYGVRILQYEPGFLHAKTIVVDQEVASVGTMNIDMRSFRLNFEANAIVYDRNVARKLHELFVTDSESCYELTLERYHSRSRISKMKEAVARLLSPIL